MVSNTTIQDAQLFDLEIDMDDFWLQDIVIESSVFSKSSRFVSAMALTHYDYSLRLQNFTIQKKSQFSNLKNFIYFKHLKHADIDHLTISDSSVQNNTMLIVFKHVENLELKKTKIDDLSMA